jgi:hypothetical protein
MSGLDTQTVVRRSVADAEPLRDYRSARMASLARPRDIRIDSLRGLMLAEITLVHLHSPIALVFYECFGRVSPAAGFVFLSGLVAGAVYSRTAEQGAIAITQRCLWRAFYIHAYHIAAFLALLALIAVAPRVNGHFHFAVGHSAADAARTVGWFAVWAYQPDLFDILPLYGLFVLFMPAALLALRRDRGLAMLAVSLAVWALAQMGLGRIADGTGHFGFFQGDFNPFAWQFVFFSGLYFGHVQIYRHRRVVAPQPALVVLCIVICVLGLTMRWQWLPWPAVFGPDGWLASKQNYGPTYLVNFLTFSYLVYYLARRFPQVFRWPPLAFLGRHSIQVFSFHVLAVYVAAPLIARAAAHRPWALDALGLVVVASLFLPAWCHSKWQQRGAAVTGLPVHPSAPAR